MCCSFLGVETRTRMRSSAPFPRGCTRTTPGACRNVGWSPVPPCCCGGESQTPPNRRGQGCRQGKSSSPRALHREGAANHCHPTCPGWEIGRGFLSRFSFSVPLPGMEKSSEQPFGRSLWQRGPGPVLLPHSGCCSPRQVGPNTGTLPPAHTRAPGHLCEGYTG